MIKKQTSNRQNIPDANALQTEPRYKKIKELDFSDMIPFVIENIRKRGIIPVLYLTVNLGFLIFIFTYAFWTKSSDQLQPGKILWQIIAGILSGSILVIIPHELLHGLAYRLLGARRIKFGADLQQFIFYVTADQFPISRMELIFLAITPFTVINIVLITIAAMWAPHFTLFLSSLLLSHNMMCIGDFAVISYALGQKGKLFTYDDLEEKRSYFYTEEE